MPAFMHCFRLIHDQMAVETPYLVTIRTAEAKLRIAGRHEV